jgi:hypothetical protein
VKYGGGPLWKNGYAWQNIYWGPYFTGSSSSAWVASIERAVRGIESDKTYSEGLSQYNVGIGKVSPLITVTTAPAAKISDRQVKQTLTGWIASGTVPNLGSRGAYNIFYHRVSLYPSRPLRHHAHSSVIITIPSTGPTDPSTWLNPIHVPKVVTNAPAILWTR